MATTLLFTLIVGGFFTLPAAYLYPTCENLHGEWLQVFLFTSVMVLSFVLAARSGYGHQLFFAALGMAAELNPLSKKLRKAVFVARDKVHETD